jgi:hypothetical protein
VIKALGISLTSIILTVTMLWPSRTPLTAPSRLSDALISDATDRPGLINAGSEFMPPLLSRNLLTDTSTSEAPFDPVSEREGEQINPVMVNSLAPGMIITNTTALTTARAIASDPTIITFADFITQPHPATAAVLTTPLTFFPTHGIQYAVLSTGNASSILNPGTYASTNWFGDNVRGNTDFDVTIWRIGLNVPIEANCLGLDFQFLSEEYPSYVRSVFNDAFIGELDESTWTTVVTSTISAPNNFIFDTAGNPITINSVVGLAATHGSGTAFDGGVTHGGATGLLTARTPISPGPHTLYLSILDQGDHIFDSAVLIDNLVLFNAFDCEAGVVEKPKIYLPVIVKYWTSAPDLVVDKLTASSNAVTVVIKNIGNAPVTNPFWVDVYLNPNPAPTRVNQHWWEVAGQGLVWGVTTPIPAGDTLTLTMDDPYYSTFHSRFTGSLVAGTPIWAQVDSINLNSDYGGVLELHEMNGGAYNNLHSILLTADFMMVDEPVAANGLQLPASSSQLPPRR